MTIPATNFLFKFPKGKNGVAAYLNGSGIYKKFILSAESIEATPSGKFTDSVTDFIQLIDVEVSELGLVYDSLTDVLHKEYFAPDINVEFEPKQFKIYYGNIYNPAGSIVYLDEKKDTRSITKFGRIDIIIVTKFLHITNCKIIDL